MSRVLDAEARVRALLTRDVNLLVEAGAGSGKTAIMAGRIALMLMEGVPAASIAAITFTELAAAELAHRVHRFVHELAEGTVDAPLAPALPDGVTPEQRAALEAAASRLDDLTCTTIHGFALDLIRPYPVEARVDPGARIMDAVEAELAFDDAFDAWLREHLTAPRADDPVAALVLDAPPSQVVAWLRTLTATVRRAPALVRPDGGEASRAWTAFTAAIDGFEQAVRRCSFAPPEVLDCVAGLHAFAVRGAEHRGSRAATTWLTLAQRLCEEHTATFTKEGTLRQYRTKGKWADAAKGLGLSKHAGVEAFERSASEHAKVCAAFEQLTVRAADELLAGVIASIGGALALYRDRKRAAALLDFDDLLEHAVGLLRDHPSVRHALGERYRFVLVDEFQDTDPRQAEIVWRLTGTPERETDPWHAWPSRPGARFVVGDPKQAIYRFRGADVLTYLRLRERLEADPSGERLEIDVNFRSRPELLERVNRTFTESLSAAGQPGYAPLRPFRAPGSAPAVRTLPVTAPAGSTKVSAAMARELEAEAVANLCRRLIDEPSAIGLPELRAGDIALLAPTGTELWRFERALERRGVAVTSQAGKGFYRRQEVQDLVALARALAFPSDRLALGAVLRGPLVGASDEALLDASETLSQLAPPRDRLSVVTDPEAVPAGVVRRALERLGPLAHRARSTTPYALLSAAVERLEVRAVVLDRYRWRGDRALANVERFLARSRAYDVRGLTAFAQDVWTEWNEDRSELEGRPDAEREAVTLITMHSAKGLEWPVVVPVNALSTPRAAEPPFVDRDTGRIAHKVLKRPTSEFAAAERLEATALAQERERLWYVTATRACDLLVVPQPSFPIDGTWLGLVPWALDDAAPIEVVGAPLHDAPPPFGDTAQTADVYQEEARRIVAATPVVRWVQPSRHEATSVAGPGDDEVDEDTVDSAGVRADGDATAESTTVRADDEATDEIDVAPVPSVVGAGADRGILLHKLLEELVTGEADADHASLRQRAVTLLGQLPTDPGRRPDPEEIAATALRAWSLPQVAGLRERLVAEMDVAGHEQVDDATVLYAGVADAVALDETGLPTDVIDWKSDVNPSPAVLERYREQLRAYLRLTGAPTGWLVLATRGRVERVG
jgi:ATP-dependent exoDNAse (exonuclease V) beta subunit